MASRHAKRLEPGTAIGTIEVVTLAETWLSIPDDQQLTHMQFRRFAGCPVCNLHLRSVVQRHSEITSAGIREVVLFHSTAEELREYTAELPFAVVADPEKRLYAEFGVEASPRGMLTPRAWWPIARAVARSAWAIARRRERSPAAVPDGGRYGLPADFLIAPDGRIIALKYGDHVYDQWSVDELLILARQYATSGQAF